MTRGRRGERIVDDSFFVIFNAHGGRIDFTLPHGLGVGRWSTVFDTASEVPRPSRRYKTGDRVRVSNRSLILLRRDD
jgi:glycogen operon protein